MMTIPLIAAALLGAPQTTTPQAATSRTGSPTTGTPAKPAVGAAVADQSGAPVGTITQINGAIAVIDTGTSKAGVPLTAIGPGPNGGLIATVTKAQLDAAASQGAAQLKTLLVPGADVRPSDGTTPVGTVKTVDAQFVTLTTPKGEVRFPANAFTAGPNGGLMVSFTQAQFDAAVTQSLGAAAK